MNTAPSTTEPNTLKLDAEQALNEEILEHRTTQEHRLQVDQPEKPGAAKSPCCGCCGG